MYKIYFLINLAKNTVQLLANNFKLVTDASKFCGTRQRNLAPSLKHFNAMVLKVRNDDVIFVGHGDAGDPREVPTCIAFVVAKCANDFTIRSAYLYPTIARVADEHEAVAIDCNTLWVVKLALQLTLGAEREAEFGRRRHTSARSSLNGEHADLVMAVVADDNAFTVRSHCHAGRLVEETLLADGSRFHRILDSHFKHECAVTV